jgi:hypothetical protein
VIKEEKKEEEDEELIFAISKRKANLDNFSNED